MIRNLQFGIIIFFLAATVLFAQEKQSSEKKIAFVYEPLFFDKQTGIKDFSLLEKLVSKSKSAISQTDSEDNKQSESNVYNPAKEQLYELLKLVEKQENLLILKISETSSEFLGLNSKFEVTKNIISFINNKSNKSIEKLKLDVPEGKIRTINTRLFYDSQKGINKLIKLQSKYPNQREICLETRVCIEIGNAIQQFVAKKGYGIIFDSSKTLPAEINDFQMIDATSEFITEFNKSNK